jgi:hypothetical protein
MWHCSVKPSRRRFAWEAKSTPKVLQNAKELLRQGAYGVQTLYMTERMKINHKPRATANRGAVLFQALY